jgi:GntR family transcriptional regulator
MRTMPLDSALAMPLREASRPLYHRVYCEISREIESGSLQPGDRLPSERSLCDALGVSRATVRRAIEELAADGLIEGRGRAWVIADDALVEPPNTLMSMSEVGRSRGLETSALVVAAKVRAATIDEAELFGIAPGAELFELERVRMLDGLPIAVDENRVPLQLAPELTDLDFTSASLYETLERAGNPPRRAEYELEARGADASEAALLGLARGTPVLFATTVAIGEQGRVVDLGRTAYRADRYRFQATLTRRTQTTRGNSNEEDLARGPDRHVGARRGRVRRHTG